jgi:hypothetical protein
MKNKSKLILNGLTAFFWVFIFRMDFHLKPQFLPRFFVQLRENLLKPFGMLDSHYCALEKTYYHLYFLDLLHLPDQYWSDENRLNFLTFDPIASGFHFPFLLLGSFRFHSYLF